MPYANTPLVRNKGRRYAAQQLALPKHPPSATVSSSLPRLFAQGARIVPVQGQGNCLFAALADQENGRQQDHKEVRAKIFHYIEAHPKVFAPFIIGCNVSEYVKQYSVQGAWGGGIELRAAALMYGVNVVVHRPDGPDIVIRGDLPPPARTFHVVYNGRHYDSLRFDR